VIDAHLDDLTAVTSMKQACALLGASRATRYRRRRPPVQGPPAPRPAPPNKLTEAERQRVLAVLRSSEYCDLAPAQIWARLLDDGVYLCSISTMYRLLAVAGENRERRRQRTHPARQKPELIARRPNQVWSWDITKLQGPERGVYYELFVIIDIFSRYVVGWMVSPAETGELAEAFIADTLNLHGIAPGQLSLHADRGTSMTSKPVAQLLIDLGVARSHSRPHVSNDNPYSESPVQDAQVLPGVPRPLRLDPRRPHVLRGVLRSLQPRPPPRRHRPAHPRLRALRHRRRDPRPARRDPRRRLRGEPRPIRAPPTRTPETAHRRLDQRTHPRSTHQIRITSCLNGLDRFRPRATSTNHS
jgi:putative transposase